VPAVSHKVWSHNKDLPRGAVKINLKGLGIGNGLVEPKIQYRLVYLYLYLYTEKEREICIKMYMHAYTEECAIPRGALKINLKGLGIGNGLVEPKIQYR